MNTLLDLAEAEGLDGFDIKPGDFTPRMVIKLLRFPPRRWR